MSDTTSHDAPRRDDLHTMTLRELEAKIIASGILMSRRQIMRHCQGGTFDAKKLPATNNIEEWFIALASVDKGIADIKTLQEHRARRDATRLDMTSHDQPEILNRSGPDTTSHDATHQVMPDTDTENKGNVADPDMTRQATTDFDIFEHPYVKRLEERNEKLEAKYEAQVRRTEEIQIRSQEQLLELQRMTAVGQSETLASFMLKAKDWLLASTPVASREDTPPTDAS